MTSVLTMVMKDVGIVVHFQVGVARARLCVSCARARGVDRALVARVENTMFTSSNYGYDMFCALWFALGRTDCSLTLPDIDTSPRRWSRKIEKAAKSCVGVVPE